jgi:hypothetical protein
MIASSPSSEVSNTLNSVDGGGPDYVNAVATAIMSAGSQRFARVDAETANMLPSAFVEVSGNMGPLTTMDASLGSGVQAQSVGVNAPAAPELGVR